MGYTRFPTRDRIFRLIEQAGSPGITRLEILRGDRTLTKAKVSNTLLRMVKEGLISVNPRDGYRRRWRLARLPAPPDMKVEIRRLIAKGTKKPSAIAAVLQRDSETIRSHLKVMVRKKQVIRQTFAHYELP